MKSSRTWNEELVFRSSPVVKISWSWALPLKAWSKTQMISPFLGLCWRWWWCWRLRYRRRDLLVSHPLKKGTLKGGEFDSSAGQQTHPRHSKFESNFWPVFSLDIFELTTVIWHVQHRCRRFLNLNILLIYAVPVAVNLVSYPYLPYPWPNSPHQAFTRPTLIEFTKYKTCKSGSQ